MAVAALVAMAVLVAAAKAQPAHLPAATCFAEATPVQVAKVADARSLTLTDGRVIRLAGIEPFNLLRPELDGAEQALSQKLDELVTGEEIRLFPVSKEPDRYGRIPALVEAGETFVQEALLRAGLAIAFAGGDTIPCFDRLLSAEEEARLRGAGFWTERALPRASPQALAQRIGHFAIFEGTVLSVGNRAATTYLNFGRRWTEDVTIEIRTADRERFGGEAALAALSGKKVRARGYLQEKGGPMLAVNSPMQIEVLDPPAGLEQSAP